MKLSINKIFSGILLAIYISWMALSGVVYATPAQQIDKVQAATSSQGLKRGHNPETGKLSFIGGGSPIKIHGAGNQRDMTPENRAMNITAVYGKEFGLNNPSQELKLLKSQKDHSGNDIVHYQQTHNGVPVIAGELIVNMNANGDLLSMSGEVSSDLVLDTKPSIQIRTASTRALNAVSTWHNVGISELTSTAPELWIFDESLLTSSMRPVELVWRMEVTAKDATQPIREMMLVNAQTGNISSHTNEVDTDEREKPTIGNNNSLVPPKPEITKKRDLQQATLPLYFDLVTDEARGWIYGSDSAGNKIDVIDMATLQIVKSFILVNGATPKGMDFNLAENQIAVAQNGSGSVIFIDPDTGNSSTAIIGGKPFDVIYGRTGRAYSVGNAFGTDYIHVIDSAAHVEITKSSYAIYGNVRLAVSSDKNYLYAYANISAPTIYKFNITSDSIQSPVSSSRYGLSAYYFILLPDDSKFITDTGQVWSQDLKGQIGALGDWRGQPVYIQAHNAVAAIFTLCQPIHCRFRE